MRTYSFARKDRAGLLFCVIIIYLTFVNSCSSQQQAHPTQSLISTETSKQSPTPTRTPTTISSPTPTSTLTPTPIRIYSGTQVPRPQSAISVENADSVIRLALWGKGVNQYSRSLFSWSPQGDLIAVASSIGIFIYDSSSLNEIRFIETTGNALSVAFSPDGNTLAVGFWDGSIQLWRTSDGALLQTWSEEVFNPAGSNLATGPVEKVAFSPDGAILVSSSLDGFRLWDVSDGYLLYDADASSVISVAISPNGELLAYLEEERYTAESVYHAPVYHAPYIPGTTATAYLEEDTTTAKSAIRIMSLLDYSIVRTIEIPPALFVFDEEALAFSPDGATLVTAGHGFGDGFYGIYFIYFWNVIDGELLQTLESEYTSIPLSFSPDGSVLVFGIEYGSGRNVNEYKLEYGIEVWQIDDRIRSTRINTSEFPQNVAFLPDGAILAFSSSDGIIELWNTVDWLPVGKIDSQPLYEPKILITSDGKSLYSWDRSLDGTIGTIRQWNLFDGTIQNTFHPLPEDQNIGMAILSPDANIFVTCKMFQGKLYFWRKSDGALLSPADRDNFEGMFLEPNQITSLAFNPENILVAVGLKGGQIEVWDKRGRTPYRFTPHSGMVTSLSFSPDNKLLASASADGAIFIRPAPDPENPYEEISPIVLAGHENYVESITFSPDNTLLASGAGHEIRLWSTTDGSLIYSANVPEMNITGYTLFIEDAPDSQSIAFSPNGTVLAYGRSDGTIYLLRTSDGMLMQTLKGHTSSIASLIFSPDGLILVSSSADGSIRLWGVAP